MSSNLQRIFNPLSVPHGSLDHYLVQCANSSIQAECMTSLALSFYNWRYGTDLTKFAFSYTAAGFRLAACVMRTERNWNQLSSTESIEDTRYLTLLSVVPDLVRAYSPKSASVIDTGMSCITAWRFRNDICENWKRGAFNIGALSLTVLTTVATCTDSKKWVKILTVAHCVFNTAYLLAKPEMMPPQCEYAFDEGLEPGRRDIVYENVQAANKRSILATLALTSIRIFQMVRYEGFN